MGIEKASQGTLKYESMIELANQLLLDQKKALNYKEMFNEISQIKGFTEGQKLDKLAQFYTDLNTDGRFMALDSELWTLKRWYPLDETSEEIKERHDKAEKQDALEDELLEEDLEVSSEEEAEYPTDEEDDEFKDIDAEIDEKVDDELLEEDDFDGASFDDEDLEEEDKEF